MMRHMNTVSAMRLTNSLYWAWAESLRVGSLLSQSSFWPIAFDGQMPIRIILR